MGFSIRSELASYARLKRRCYFLFVISYGGLLAGLTYAAIPAMKPQSIVGIRPKSSPFNAAVAGAKRAPANAQIRAGIQPP